MERTTDGRHESRVGARLHAQQYQLRYHPVRRFVEAFHSLLQKNAKRACVENVLMEGKVGPGSPRSVRESTNHKGACPEPDSTCDLERQWSRLFESPVECYRDQSSARETREGTVRYPLTHEGQGAIYECAGECD